MISQQLWAQAEAPSGIINYIDKVARIPVSQIVPFLAVCTLIRIAIFPTLRTTPIHKRFTNYTIFKAVNEFCDALAYAGLFVFLIIRPFLVQTFYIPSESMIDTLKIGDYTIGNKFKYRFEEPKHGDIVIFKAGPNAKVNVEDFVKRLIGVPGDLVEVKDGLLYYNEKQIKEPYLKEPRMNFDFKLVHYKGRYIPLMIQGEVINQLGMGISPVYALDPIEAQEALALPAVKIPEKYFLMMGDNRNGSYDSRGWGLVPRQDIVAKCECIWMPINRAGIP